MKEVDDSAFVLYFGCWDEHSGHGLYDAHGRQVRESEAHRIRVPTAREMDGSTFTLPKPDRPGSGAITYLPACGCTILHWWGNPFDKRPGTNTAIITRGEVKENTIWMRFTTQFPSRLTSQIKAPVLTWHGRFADPNQCSHGQSFYCMHCGHLDERGRKLKAGLGML